MKKQILACMLAASALFACSGCDLSLTSSSGGNSKEANKLLSFDKATLNFWARNDGGNGDPFNCSFQNSNAEIATGMLTLWLTKTDGGYAGAEYRSREYYSYGLYSVSMKAAKCPGVISSFFTYTGNPWDEIDIEFLGNDTTKIQFNYYTKGQGNHEYVYDLGFDGAEEFHEYAFEWLPDSITWFVDGVAVHTATEDIPTTNAQIMMNVWNVKDSAAAWAGKFDETQLPVCAQYEWIDYISAE